MWQALQGLYQWAGQASYFILHFWESMGAVLHDWFVAMFKEVVLMWWGLLSAIPVPDVLSQFVWPSFGPVWSIASQVGLPEAMAMLTAAVSVRWSLRLLPSLLAA